MNELSIKICHIYPDVLNLYGDRGNIICLKKRLTWRGIDVQIDGAPIGETPKFNEYDIFFMGGGQDFDEKNLLDDLKSGKGKEIKAAIEDDKTFLAICGGYQILGNSYQTWQGEKQDFLGAINVETVGQKERMTGNCMFNFEELDYNIVGFENHSGKTYLGDGVRPMGKVITGFGNNGEDGQEGARYKNVFASYSHGPILPKNPKLCDYILKTGLLRKYPNIDLSQLEDDFEIAAHDYMEKRLTK